MYDFTEPLDALYIIGNGFDKAHDLPTGYMDFRNYLEKEDDNFLAEFERLFGFEPIDDSHFFGEKKDEYIKRRNRTLYDDLWKLFEKNLGEMNDQSILDFSTSIVSDLSLETGNIGILDTMNTYWKEQYSFINKLQQHLKLWAESIDISNVPIKRSDLYKANACFLNFNYTLLLEDIYKIDAYNVLHIHGSIDEDGVPPVVGHGNYKKIEEYKRKAREYQNSFDEGNESIYSALVKMYSETLKDVKSYISLNSDFFCSLNNVKNIYVIGCSYGEVDYPYFNCINNSVASDCKWTFYRFSEDDKEGCDKYIKRLKLCKTQCVKRDSNEFWD